MVYVSTLLKTENFKIKAGESFNPSLGREWMKAYNHEWRLVTYRWQQQREITSGLTKRISEFLAFCAMVFKTESFYRKIKNDSKLEKMGKKGNSPIYEPNRKRSWEESNHFWKDCRGSNVFMEKNTFVLFGMKHEHLEVGFRIWAFL